jgi:sarcosine oxidase subunit beta
MRAISHPRGGFVQRRAGTARHDAVAWGYARGGDRRWAWTSCRTARSPASCAAAGPRGRRATSRGEIRAEQGGVAVAGHSSVLAAMAGYPLPVTSYTLQAMVSEPVKPVLNTVTLSPGAGRLLEPVATRARW